MSEISDEEYSLKHILQKLLFWLKYLATNWVIIFLIALCGAGAGIVRFSISKPVYKASLTYVFSESPNTASSLGGLASQFGITTASSFSLFEGGNLTDLMKSHTILKKVLLTKVKFSDTLTTLGDKYIEVYQYRKKWDKNEKALATLSLLNVANFTNTPINYNIILNILIERIKSKNLFVDKPSKASNLMAIEFTSENELLSKFFVEVLADVVSKYYIETKTIKFSKTVNVLQHQVDSVRQMLNYAIRGVATLADVNPNVNPSRRSLLAPSQNRQVDVTASTVVLTQLIQNLESAKLQLRNETPLFQIVDTPVLPLDIEQLSLIGAVTKGIFAGTFIAILYLSLQLFFKSLK